MGSLLWIQITNTSCTTDKLPEPANNPLCDTLQVTYNNQIKPIIDASCAYAGCHFVGAPIGDYTDFVKLLPSLSDSKFKKRVIEVKDMPEGSSLSPTEFELVECWVINGYPEN